MILNHCPLCSDGAPEILTIEVPSEPQVLTEPSLLELKLATEENAETIAATEIEEVEELPDDPDALDTEEEEVAEVGRASAEGSNASNKTWQRVAIAGAAVVVATVAIILVSLNEGHHKH